MYSEKTQRRLRVMIKSIMGIAAIAKDADRQT